MANPRCRQCGSHGAARARANLCAKCWARTQPDTCDGAVVRRLRETLKITVNDAASAVGVDPKTWVDEIEGNMALDATYATAIVCALDALVHERQERRERAATQQPSKAPAGALSIEALGG